MNITFGQPNSHKMDCQIDGQFGLVCDCGYFDSVKTEYDLKRLSVREYFRWLTHNDNGESLKNAGATREAKP